ncbi:hypothetical protein, partial [Oceanospirillum multiglobuliferum]
MINSPARARSIHSTFVLFYPLWGYASFFHLSQKQHNLETCQVVEAHALRRQKQVDLSEFEAILGYRVSSRTGSRATQRNPVSKNNKKEKRNIPVVYRTSESKQECIGQRPNQPTESSADSLDVLGVTKIGKVED